MWPDVRTLGHAVALGVLLCACSRGGSDSDSAGGPPQAAPQPAAPAAGFTGSVELPSFVKLVKEQGRAVVNISATNASLPGGVAANHPLYEFFRRFGGTPDSGEGGSTSVGSGFIVSKDGYILTNAHVIGNHDAVRVKLTSKREYPATVIGADPYTDIALLKIDAKDLPMVASGDPGRMEPGDWVAAIGAPFGFENSVTVGVVSAKGRLLPNGSYVPFIQTDVAVNPGNSGGPLFNTAGQVIGINSQIYSQTGGFMGIAFAIPIDIALEISQQLREHGKVIRGRIGVQTQELSFELARELKLKDTKGAVIAALERGGPAHRAGLEPADVILAVDGHAIDTTADLARRIGSARPGSSIVIDIWRGAERRQVKVPVEMQRFSIASAD
ncbi:MAG: trypsin-like peptidase domain-containing protein [Pseudomonadota bacterium]